MTGLVIRREVDLSDHTVMFVVTGRHGCAFEVHCDRCGHVDVFDTEVAARREGTRCAACDCSACEGTGEVAAGDFYNEEDWTGVDADIPCPRCYGTGRS